MAGFEAVAVRTYKAHEAALAVIQKHGSKERRDSLAEMTHFAIPGLNKPVEFTAFQAELVAGLAEVVEGLLEEQSSTARSSKKK